MKKIAIFTVLIALGCGRHLNAQIQVLPDTLFDKSLLGKQAPDFEVISMDGQRFKLSNLNGKIVLINFWHVKCAVCILEFPDLNKIQNEYGEKIQILSMAVNSADELLEFMERAESGYRLKRKFHDTEEIHVPIIAESQDIHELYGVKVYPITFIIDKAGEVVSAEFYLYSYYSPDAITNYDHLKRLIDDLLK